VAEYFPGKLNDYLDVVVQIARRPICEPPPPPSISSLPLPTTPQPLAQPDFADVRQGLTNDFNKYFARGFELPIWTPKTPCSETIRRHIEKLCIPETPPKDPSLLFHNLGSASAHGMHLQHLASSLFSKKKQVK
jgi:hypothetical protein